MVTGALPVCYRPEMVCNASVSLARCAVIFPRVDECVTVIGDGAFGTVAAVLLATNGRRVTMWGRNPARLAEIARTRINERYLPEARLPDSVLLEPDPHKAISGATLLVWGVPTQFLRSMAEE